MIALEEEGQSRDEGGEVLLKKEQKGRENVSVKYREKVNGIFSGMKDEGRHIETWEGERRGKDKK